jgi:hypothetical protein
MENSMSHKSLKEISPSVEVPCRETPVRKILSIDGGGIRGVFPATVLAELEEHLDQPLHRYFDLIAGTSTGGIIAIGLALGVPARDIADLYVKKGPEIFFQERGGVVGGLDRLRASLTQWFAPKYAPDRLHRELEGVLGALKIGNAQTRLLVPAFNARTKKVHIIKTSHAERLMTDFRMPAVDAAMATAAAPTFLPRHMTAQGIGLVDGGLWANNPAGPAVIEGIGTLGWSRESIRVLSIGCLEDVSELPESAGRIGIARQVQDFFMAGQAHSSMGFAHVLTGDVGGSSHKAIYRVTQPIPPNEYHLDATNKIHALRERGLIEAREQTPNLLPVFFADTVDQFVPFHAEVAS